MGRSSGYGIGVYLGIFSRTQSRRSGGMFVWNWRGTFWIFWMGPSLIENDPQSLQLMYSHFAEVGGHSAFELSRQLSCCGHDAFIWGYAWVGDVLVFVEKSCGDSCRSCVLHPYCSCAVMSKIFIEDVAFSAMLCTY